MKSSKFVLVTMVTAFSLNAFTQVTAAQPGPTTQSAATKQVCDQYLQTDQTKLTSEAQVDQVINVMNVGYDFKYDQEQMKKLKTKFMEILGINPKKLNDFQNGAFFVCTTQLSAEDKAVAKAQFDPIVGQRALEVNSEVK